MRKSHTYSFWKNGRKLMQCCKEFEHKNWSPAGYNILWLKYLLNLSSVMYWGGLPFSWHIGEVTKIHSTIRPSKMQENLLASACNRNFREINLSCPCEIILPNSTRVSYIFQRGTKTTGTRTRWGAPEWWYYRNKPFNWFICYVRVIFQVGDIASKLPPWSLCLCNCIFRGENDSTWSR